MASSSGPSTKSDEEVLFDLLVYRTKMIVLFDSQPVICAPPILCVPESNSSEELEMIRSICLEAMSHSDDVRRSVLAGKRDFTKIAVIALAVFRCPDSISYATYGLAHLSGRMLILFREWRFTWLFDVDCPASMSPIERLRRQALKNLSFSSKIEESWLDIFLRVFGDLPEVWGLESSYPPAGPSGSSEDGNMSTYIPDAVPFQTPQTIPSMLETPASLGIDGGVGNSAGPSDGQSWNGSSLQSFQTVSNPGSDTYQSGFVAPPFPGPSVSDSFTATPYDNSGLPQPLAYLMAENAEQGVYQGDFGSTTSLPLISFPDSALDVYHGDASASHSLPNLPFIDTGGGMQIDGVDAGWSAYNAASLGHHGDVSESGSTQYDNFLSGPQRSNLATAVQSAPANASQFTMPPHATTGATPASTSSLGNSMAFSAPLTSASTPFPARKVTASPNVRQGIRSNSRRFAPAPMRPRDKIRDAIATENARAITLANRNGLLRSRTGYLAEYLQVFLINLRFFYDGLYRILCSEYVGVPLTAEHRAALLEGPKSIGQMMACMFRDWKRDMEI